MNIIPNEPPKSQCYQDNSELYYTEEEIRQQEEDWADYEEPVDPRLLFIERYHTKKDVFFVGLKSHKWGKGFDCVKRYKKGLLDNEYYYKNGSEGAVTHTILNNYRWDARTHAEEWLHTIDGIPVDIDTGTSPEAKRRAFDRVMNMHINHGVEVDCVSESVHGIHPVIRPEKPIYYYQDKKHTKINTKPVELIKDFKRLLVDYLGGDVSQPGITMMVATPYAHDLMYANPNRRGINIGKMISVVKSLSKTQPLTRAQRLKVEEYTVSRNCKAFTLALLCYAYHECKKVDPYKRTKEFALDLVTQECPTLTSREINTIVKSAFSGNYYGATNIAIRNQCLGRSRSDAARRFNIIPTYTREECAEIRRKQALMYSKAKKEETSALIKAAVERIHNDGLTPSIRLISKYASIGAHTAMRHKGISW